MLNGITYTEGRFKAQHHTLSNSWVNNFLEILWKLQIDYFSSLNGYLKQISEISLKPVPEQGWKTSKASHEQSDEKSDFLVWFQQQTL